jgi:2-succinyl-5-enolpyruvyl-6-hydroxy-3-cyclohexene-1-carboxylate synthase
VGPSTTAQAPRCDAFDLLLRDAAFVERYAPDLVLQFGQAPLSRALERYLEHHSGCRRWVVSRGWHDPSGRATSLVFGDVGAVARTLVAALPERAPGGEWERAFVSGDERIWTAVDAELADGALSEGSATRLLAKELHRDALLVLSNSLPIRHVDTYVRGDSCDATVLTQRGANGIDGLISSTSGAASVRRGPVALLMGDAGDAAFAHDLGGLAVARKSTVPLAVVVLNNRGGRIFEQLPMGERAELRDALERHVIMPQELDIERAAKLFGVGFTRTDAPSALGLAIRGALDSPGCTVIEATVPPRGAAEMIQRLGSTIR